MILVPEHVLYSFLSISFVASSYIHGFLIQHDYEMGLPKEGHDKL